MVLDMSDSVLVKKLLHFKSGLAIKNFTLCDYVGLVDWWM